jgi:DNA-binding CsgD family transcriptional regulator
MSSREITAKLYVSGNTVKTHSNPRYRYLHHDKNSESEPIFLS